MIGTLRHNEVVIDSGGDTLFGTLTMPREAAAIILFAHGSGSSRFSPRNKQVAQYFNDRGLGTLLFDLLTAEENDIDELTRQYRFDIPLLGRRLDGAVDWLVAGEDFRDMPLGLFGASTGAAAALITAADRPGAIFAVVSRGGRPDLAGAALGSVRAPVLLIVGGHDSDVIDLNRRAAAQLACEHEVRIVPGATHLFPEPGKLDEVCRLAADWFEHYLAAAKAGSKRPPWVLSI